MKFHGIQINEGSNVSNLTVASGTSFPPNANEGELFFRSDANISVKGLYLFIGEDWDRIASADSITTPVGAVFPTTSNTGDLFYKDSNDSFEGLYVYNGTSWSPATSSTGSSTIIGDVSGILTIGTNSTLFLATVNSSPGTYGSSDKTIVLTTTDKGLVTSADQISIGIDGSQVTSGVFVDGRVQQSNVTQHQAALSLSATQLTSGVLSNARVQQSNVTQHQAALSIAETQIPDGTIFPRLNGTETITGTYQFNNPIIVPAPSSGSHATSKDYVDQSIAGLSWKNSVRAGTTSNVLLSGEQTIDGISLTAGQRVLVKNQSTAAENGVYVVKIGAWARAEDFDSISPADEINSAAVFVQQGTVNADTAWTQVSPVSSVGVDAITFTQFAGANTFIAGSGLTLTTNTFNVGTASSSRIVVNTDDIDLAMVGTSVTDSLRKISTDSYGRVTGTSAVSVGDLSTILDATYVNVTGDTMTGALTINASNSGLILTSAAGSARRIQIQTGSSTRWIVGADNSAEAGSNVGSNFVIYRYDDTGAFVDSPLTISRSNGLISSASSFYISKNTPVLSMNTAASAQTVQIDFRTANSMRWAIQKNNTAEAGANAGSNFSIIRYDDAGSIVDTPFMITRSNGASLFSGNVGIGTTSPTVSLSLTKTLTGGTSVVGVRSIGAIQSDATSSATYFQSIAGIAGSTSTSLIDHFTASQTPFDSTSTASVQKGFTVQSSMIGAGTNYGFFGNLGITTVSVTNLSLTSNVVSITTGTAHGFTVGTQVILNVSAVAGGNGIILGNEVVVVSSVPSSTTFTAPLTNANVTSKAATGTAATYGRYNLYMQGSAPNYLGGSLSIGPIFFDPIVALDVVGFAEFLSDDDLISNQIEVGRLFPEARISVVSTTNEVLSGSAAGDSFFYNASTGKTFVGTAAASDLVFFTNKVERMRISSTGTVTIPGSIVNGNSGTATTTTSVSTATGTTIDSFSSTSFRTAKYIVQVFDSTNTRFHSVEILLIHDGATVYKTEYAEVVSSVPLGTFDASITTGTLNLTFTATAASSKTVKVHRTAITV